MLDKAISIVCTVEAAQRQYEKKCFRMCCLNLENSVRAVKRNNGKNWKKRQTKNKQTNKQASKQAMAMTHVNVGTKRNDYREVDAVGRVVFKAHCNRYFV